MIDKLHIRPANNSDTKSIYSILNFYAKEQVLLPREVLNIDKNIDNFIVAYSEDQFIGCVALRDFSNNLFEVRSLAVSPDYLDQRIGSMLIEHVIDKLKEKGNSSKLFALTYRVNFFKRQGFSLVSRDLFPEKIWSDCSICPKKDNCDEDAVLIEVG